MSIRRDILRNIAFGRLRIRVGGWQLSAHLTKFLGSWLFLIAFASLIAGWIIINDHLSHPFDHYPYILLSLILGIICTVMSPIILMSSNRSAIRDRMVIDEVKRSSIEAKIEISIVNSKIDEIKQTLDKIIQDKQ